MKGIFRQSLPTMKPFLLFLTAAFLITTRPAPAAGLLDQLGVTGKSNTLSGALAALPQDQAVTGLKEALAKGLTSAVGRLGRDGGFLTNLSVKIPMPSAMQKVESTARTLKQGALVDEFVRVMNVAAEKAVPEAAVVFGDAVKQMSIADAKQVLSGTTNAATTYFRRTTETNLYARFLPIVKKATDSAGVSSAYKKLLDTAGLSGETGKLITGFGALTGRQFDPKSLDLDDYVTRKALDGLFVMVGDEEKRIRENPAARTTDLLKKVFGAAAK